MRWLLFLLLAILPLAAAAQDAATLVADRVEIRADQALVAEGAVEVLYEGTRLSATRVIYDRAADRLTIDGPITLTDPEGTILLADQAALSPDLTDGILRGARLVLDRELQLAAAEIARAGGRYTALSRVVASACQVCPGNPTPLWEIRARRVIHDTLERQLYFEGAQFRVAGLPVAYVPRLRLPDPTLERATGLLAPVFRSTSALGFGVKLPYFIVLGPSRDLTLAPYLSAGTRTLEARYRQAFRFGSLEVEGAVSRDDIREGELRYYVFAEGSFVLPREFRLQVVLREVSDPGYLLDYGYGDQDRLDSFVSLNRTRRLEYFEASAISTETLRETERVRRGGVPSRNVRLDWERRIPLSFGELRVGANAAYLERSFDADELGRDVQRTGISGFWRGGRVFGPGLVAGAVLGAEIDAYRVADDDAFEDVTRTTPRAAVELRWPLSRAGDGTFELLEPVVQLAWADPEGGPVPNEDSLAVEFDEGNLFALDRNPGRDRIEDGLRANLGLFYTRSNPGGWGMGLGLGRIFRLDGSSFDEGAGLAGETSAWLATGRLEMGERLRIGNRALFEDRIIRNELFIDWDGERADFQSAYLYLEEDPAADRDREIHELTLDAAWRIDGNWSGRFDSRFDLEEGRAARAGLGLTWRNECLEVDLSLSRRFTSSASVDPDTGIGVSVALAGFGADDAPRGKSRACIR